MISFYDISVYHLFFRTAYHKPIGKSTFLPTSPVKSAPCSIATFLCLFPLFIGPYCRLRLLAVGFAAALAAALLLLLPRRAELPPADAETPTAPDAAMDPLSDGLPDLLYRRGRAGVPCVHRHDAEPL